MQLSASQVYAARPRPGGPTLGGQDGLRRRPRRRGWPGRGLAMTARAGVVANVVFGKHDTTQCNCLPHMSTPPDHDPVGHRWVVRMDGAGCIGEGGWAGRGSAMMASAGVAAGVVFAKTRNDPRVKRPRACPMQPSAGMRPGGGRKALPPDQGAGGKAFPPCAGCKGGPRWRRRRGRRGFRKPRGDPMQLSASQGYATGLFTGWDGDPVVRGGPDGGGGSDSDVAWQ
jgi:hypothetical protein